ncbi:hypothetical protein [uncultured Amnibacterium sp.]|uniref:hypothetical protein n=1 Tax=uncultured Amnibacterium sp. TaxID=1631851 RepID=UPI0035CAC71F
MTVHVLAQGAPRRGPKVLVAVLFLLGFLWQGYGAVSNLVAWLGLANVLGEQLTATAWVVLLLGIAIPIVAYAAAVLLGRQRSAVAFALVMVLALCASEALSLSQLAFFLSIVGAL